MRIPDPLRLLKGSISAPARVLSAAFIPRGALAFPSVPIGSLVLSATIILAFLPLNVGLNVSQGLLALALAIFAASSVMRGRYLVIAGRAYFPLILTFLLVTSQAIGTYTSPVEEKTYVTPLLFIICLLLTTLVAVTKPLYFSDKWLGRSIRFLILFFVFEAVTRYILGPRYLARPQNEGSFYLYKASFFYFDSNFVGIAIICLLAIMLAHRHLFGRAWFVLLYVLLLGTLSRASIFAGIIQLVLANSAKHRKALAWLLLICAPAIAYYLFGQFTSGSSSIQNIDGSFATKFYLLEQMVLTLQYSTMTQLLFGIGAGNTAGLLGMFAHNILVTAVLEFGAVGTLLLFVFVGFFCRKSPAAFYLLVLPVAMNGFSVVSASMPYFFVALGLLAATEFNVVQRTRNVCTTYT